MSDFDPFRNQYILTTKKRIDEYGHWNQKSITAPNVELYHHPSLSVNTVQEEEDRLVCIGYILDPKNPTLTNKQVLTRLLDRVTSEKGLFRELAPLGGRYTLLAEISGRQLVIPDASALRPVLYGTIDQETVVTSSAMLGLNWFDSSQRLTAPKQEYIRQADYWIGTGTDDDRLTRVLANHFLDLDEMEVARMPYVEPSTNEPIQHASSLLSGTMSAIASRFENPHIWLSGGLDSRILLAASKPVSDKFRYIAFDREDTKESDVRIAKQLGNKLQIDVEIVDPPAVSDEFREQIETAFCSPRHNNAQSNIEAYIGKDSEYVITSGIVSEVTRTRYEHPTKEISVKTIYDLMNPPQTKYCQRELERLIQQRNTKRRVELTHMTFCCGNRKTVLGVPEQPEKLI